MHIQMAIQLFLPAACSILLLANNDFYGINFHLTFLGMNSHSPRASRSNSEASCFSNLFLVENIHFLYHCGVAYKQRASSLLMSPLAIGYFDELRRAIIQPRWASPRSKQQFLEEAHFAGKQFELVARWQDIQQDLCSRRLLLGVLREAR